MEPKDRQRKKKAPKQGKVCDSCQVEGDHYGVVITVNNNDRKVHGTARFCTEACAWTAFAEGRVKGLQPPPPPPLPEDMRQQPACIPCSRVYPDGVEFCPYCGNPVAPAHDLMKPAPATEDIVPDPLAEMRAERLRKIQEDEA